MQEFPNLPTEQNESFDIKAQLYTYLAHWKWFLLAVTVALGIAFLYLRYAVPQYKATATILVKDDKKGGLASELGAFADMGVLSNVKSNVDNEIEIIKSRTLIEHTLQDLGCTTAYFAKGRVKMVELYQTSPVNLMVKEAEDTFLKQKKVFTIESTDDRHFRLTEGDQEIGVFQYDANIKREGATLVVVKTKTFQAEKDFALQVVVQPSLPLAENFQKRLTVGTVGKNTSVIELSIVDPVKEKAVDFLDQLVENYNQDAIDDKKFVSENTSKFIDNRLALITEELQTVEEDVETFKKKNHVTDIVSEAGIFLENASAVEKEKLAVLTQLKVVETMMEYLDTADLTEPIPVNIITQDQGAASLITQYNQLILERNRYMKSAGSKNAMVVALEGKINSLRENVKASLVQYQASLEIQKADLARQNARVSGKISEIPTQERIFRDIDRKQHVKEALFLYLLQKREETAIALAVTEPNAKVIDKALAATTPVAPKRAIIFLGAFLLGLIVPFGVIYTRDLLDTKVHSRHDITQRTTLPFLGDIPHLPSADLLVPATSRSATAEALRMVRTNLEFLLTEVPEGSAKTIFLTSTFSKEGKTFVSANLASLIAQSEKRVLLIGMDIRNPKLSDYFQLPQKGLTNYLAKREATNVADYIVASTEIPHLDILPSGIIPPNPAELLMGTKVGDMLDSLRTQYDYIIVDTAPVNLVADTLLVGKQADAFVYVARANFLDKRMLELPQKLYTEQKLQNMAIVLNDTDSKMGYGYGYGYGYGHAPEPATPFWKRMLKR
jgi:capsular exopolysaccharide synthesis family protein